jgi:FMN hydrolase / 5-amino-6-(5-phospho-D-ribitylamino)uracil phosphatase
MALDDRVLVFDVMGTIVYEPFVEVLPRILGLSLAELIEQKDPTVWVEFERGEIDEAELERRFFADGRAYDHAGMKAAMRDAYAYLDGMEALLGRLADEGYPLHLMSNYPSWYRMIEEKLSLSRYASWTFVSCHAGVRKPDPEAYRWLAERLERPLEKLVFVDDREVNCAAARELGVDAIRYEHTPGLRRALVERGLLAGTP